MTKLPSTLFSLEFFAREFLIVSKLAIKCLWIEQLVLLDDNIVESGKFRLG